MIDITVIDESNVSAFMPMIRAEAAALVDVYLNQGMDDRLIMLGLVDDDAPIAALVCELLPDEGTADFVSLFVDANYRRQGLATDLVISVCTILSQQEYDFVVTCSVAERFGLREGDPVRGADLKGLFRYLDFQEEELTNVGSFYCTLGDLQDNALLKAAGRMKFKHFSELSRMEKNFLSEEDNPFLIERFTKGKMDEDLSLFLTDEDSIKACLCMESDETSVTMDWARVEPESRIALVEMFGNAFRTLLAEVEEGKRSMDTVIHLPYINDASKALIQKMLGAAARVSEKQFWYSYSLIDETLEPYTDEELAV